MLLLDGNGLSTAPGRKVQLAVDRLVGTDADIILLVLGQLGQVLGSLSGVHMLSTLEVLLGAILNLIADDGGSLLDSDLSLLALVVLDTVDLRSLDDDLSSGLVGRADDLAAISAADDQIIGTALLGGSGDYVFLLCCCCSVLASSGDLDGSVNFFVATDLAGVDQVVMAVLGASSLYDAFFIGNIDISAIVAMVIIVVVRNGNFFDSFLGLILIIDFFLAIVSNFVSNLVSLGTSNAIELRLNSLVGYEFNLGDLCQVIFFSMLIVRADGALAVNLEQIRISLSSLGYKIITIVQSNLILEGVGESGNIELECIALDVASCGHSFIGVVVLSTTAFALDILIFLTYLTAGSSSDFFGEYLIKELYFAILVFLLFLDVLVTLQDG